MNPRVLWPFVSFLALTSYCFVESSVGTPAESTAFNKQKVTVQDGVEMTRLADPDYDDGATGHVAQFSPDGKRFVVVLKKGNLDQNTNEFCVLLFRTAEAWQSPKPDILLKMSSSSNRDAVSKVRWLADNETLVFLGENPGEATQIYAFNVRAGRVKKLTNHPTAVTNYNITADGQKILFLADPGARGIKDREQALRDGVVIADQSLPSLLAGNCGTSIYCGLGAQELFLQTGRRVPTKLPLKDVPRTSCPLSFSPDGRYAVVGVNVASKNLPHTWEDYEFPENEYIHSFFKNMKGVSLFSRFLLLDTKTRHIESLWDAPMIQFPALTWASDSQSFSFRSYLPLEGTDAGERKDREDNQYPVEVRVPSREFRKLKEDEFANESSMSAPLDVTLEEDLNTPPKIFVSSPAHPQKAMLLDLNPQFSRLNLGKVETIEWQAAKAIQVSGGLYLPPDFVPGRRYPLVIQTHGFDPSRFSMDGLYDWSSGYAARFLAAKGIVVLQAFKSQEDDERLYNDPTLGATLAQAVKNFQVSAYESAIDELDREHMIDRDRVGIMGFSRTVCSVAYALTHSKYHFAAAILVDGIDCGYFQYLAWGGHPDLDELSGGAAPFGEGLAMWLKESPGFNLDKVTTPVRLEAHGASAGLLEVWEWFSGLSRLGKPVECILFPNADHMLTKPWERSASQQETVSWFRFWLMGEEDEEDSGRPTSGQWARWKLLRRQRQADTNRLRMP